MRRKSLAGSMSRGPRFETGSTDMCRACLPGRDGWRSSSFARRNCRRRTSTCSVCIWATVISPSTSEACRRLRIFLDRRYPGIVGECAAAMAEVRPRSRVHRLNRRHSGDVIVSSYSKAWTALFPQHGPGMKHRRDVSLKPWQDELAASRPELLLRGLIQSDGCRFINPGRRWRCPRYTFSNRSDDILAIFKTACDRLGLHWTTGRTRSTSHASQTSPGWTSSSGRRRELGLVPCDAGTRRYRLGD
jgi:hypothetical protein